MWNKGSWTIAVALGACVALTGCGSSGSEASAGAAKDKPAVVEKAANGSDPARVTLTEQAVKRLDIKTVSVSEEQVAGQQRKVIPYSAVIYDAKGLAWTFTSPQPRTYVRQRISVEQISGDRAVLSEGPTAGTTIVTVGAAELYGAELGVGK